MNLLISAISLVTIVTAKPHIYLYTGSDPSILRNRRPLVNPALVVINSAPLRTVPHPVYSGSIHQRPVVHGTSIQEVGVNSDPSDFKETSRLPSNSPLNTNADRQGAVSSGSQALQQLTSQIGLTSSRPQAVINEIGSNAQQFNSETAASTQQIIATIASHTQQIADSAISVNQALQQLNNQIVAAAAAGATGVSSTAQQIGSGFAASAQQLGSFIPQAASGLTPSAQKLTSKVSEDEPIDTNHRALASSAGQALQQINNQIVDAATTGAAGLSAAQQVGSNLASNSQNFVNGFATSVPQTIVNGFASQAQQIGSGITANTQQIGTGLAANAQQIGSGIASAAQQFGSGAVSYVPLVGGAIATGAQNFNNGLISSAQQFGNVITSSSQQFSNAVGSATGAAQGTFQNLIAAAKPVISSDYQIHFTNQIGSGGSSGKQAAESNASLDKIGSVIDEDAIAKFNLQQLGILASAYADAYQRAKEQLAGGVAESANSALSAESAEREASTDVDVVTTAPTTAAEYSAQLSTDNQTSIDK